MNFKQLEFKKSEHKNIWNAEGVHRSYTIRELIKNDGITRSYNVYCGSAWAIKSQGSLESAIKFCQNDNNDKLKTIAKLWILEDK